MWKGVSCPSPTSSSSDEESNSLVLMASDCWEEGHWHSVLNQWKCFTLVIALECTFICVDSFQNSKTMFAMNDYFKQVYILCKKPTNNALKPPLNTMAMAYFNLLYTATQCSIPSINTTIVKAIMFLLKLSGKCWFNSEVMAFLFISQKGSSWHRTFVVDWIILCTSLFYSSLVLHNVI